MIDNWGDVKKADDADDLCFGTVESWIVYRLTGGADGGVHVSDVTNACRTLLLNLRSLQWDPVLLKFFGLKESMLPRLVSSSEVYGRIAHGALRGVQIAGLAGDQQAALVGNKCLRAGEAKCTYGTGAFLLFCTGEDVVESRAGLLSTVAYQNGPGSRPVYCLEGSSTCPAPLRARAPFAAADVRTQSASRAAPSSGSATRCTWSRRPRTSTRSPRRSRTPAASTS